MKVKSLVCPITPLEKDRQRALHEVAHFAAYQELEEKKTLRMRLLAEELLGMVGTVLDIRQGEFWVECQKERYALHLKAKAKVGERAGVLLVQVSSEKMNRAYQGVTGKIRKALDVMTDPDALEAAGAAPADAGAVGNMAGFGGSGRTSEWSYRRFQKQQKKDEELETWDALETSILEKLSDDILVSVRPREIRIVVKIG